MTHITVDSLRATIRDGGSYSEVAVSVGTLCSSGATIATCRALMEELKLLGAQLAVSSPSSTLIHQHLKTGLGLGILVAQQPRTCQLDYLARSFFSQIDKDSTPRLSRELLLNELCNLDQFLTEDAREESHTRYKGELCALTWSPTIRDYCRAWERLVATRELDYIRPEERRPGPHVILVMSAKGGTGKSVTALATAHFIQSQGVKCALLDLDASGPTAQYSLDIPDVTSALVPLPGKGQESAWCYSTFLDLVKQCRAHPEPVDGRVRDLVSKCIYPVQGAERLSVVLLPESPTYCAEVLEGWFDESGQEAIIAAAEASIDQLAEIGCEYAVVDLGPGVYGTNGVVAKWVSMTYPSSVIMVTSPRASDIATALYETPWLASPHEFAWTTPLLHFLNRWDYSTQESFSQTIRSWADGAVASAVTSSFVEKPDITSGSLIHMWRFWPLFYQLALPLPQLKLASLPEDDAIRRLLQHDATTGQFPGVDLGELARSAWYRRFLTPQLRMHILEHSKR